MTQKSLDHESTPALSMLLGGTIFDISRDLDTQDPILDEAEAERYLEYHALDFLREAVSNNTHVQKEILYLAQDGDFDTPSPYEKRDTIPNLMETFEGDNAAMWNRVVGHFFERFLVPIREGVLGQ